MTPALGRRWNDDRTIIATVYEVPADQRHRAALVVCGRARDVADARLIMQALGLSDYTAARYPDVPPPEPGMAATTADLDED